MQSTFQSLSRYSTVFLFVILQMICILLIVEFNEKQGKIFSATSTAFTSWLYNTKDNFTRIFYYDEVNNKISEDNARLFQRLEESKFNNIIITEKSDSSDYIDQYTYTAARVINNSNNRPNNYITINRGTKHGVKPNTGLIGSNGIAGIILASNDWYSIAMSVLHRQSKISVAIRRNNYFGNMVWDAKDPNIVKIEAIPRHADVVVGDTIVTSGYSAIFPKGLSVAIIEKVEKEKGSSFHLIKARLTEDINQLEHVYIVHNDFAKEQLELEEKIKNE